MFVTSRCGIIAGLSIHAAKAAYQESSLCMIWAYLIVLPFDEQVRVVWASNSTRRDRKAALFSVERAYCELEGSHRENERSFVDYCRG